MLALEHHPLSICSKFVPTHLHRMSYLAPISFLAPTHDENIRDGCHVDIQQCLRFSRQCMYIHIVKSVRPLLPIHARAETNGMCSSGIAETSNTRLKIFHRRGPVLGTLCIPDIPEHARPCWLAAPPPF